MFTSIVVRRGLGALAALVGFALLLPAAPTSAATQVDFARAAGGLSQPTQVTAARDGNTRMFVVEKTGTVRVFHHGRVLGRPFIDLRSRVRTAGEGGLLSIAFHPHYRSHPYVWAAYTDRGGDVTVARFRASSAGANHVRARSYHRVITVSHPAQFSNHFAGQLVFGRGGYLFMSTGDGGGGGDPFEHAQDVRTLQGKILRLKVLHAQADCGRIYCAPRTNPYAGPTPGRATIWVVGVRNAWRFSIDPATGDIWVADVGQDRFEEIDRIPAGRGGANLGWSCKEGTATYDPSHCRSGASYLEPEWTYGRDYGTTVTGGFVYRGSRLADDLGGLYVGGDFGSGRIFVGDSTGLTTIGHLERVTSFGEDDGHELWAVTIDGGLYRMQPS